MGKCAVLFSGGIDALNNKPRYAHDIAFAYKVLKDKMGFNAGEINILYSDGSYINMNGNLLSTKRASKQNFNRIIQDQSQILRDNDIFLLLVTNHGHTDGSICTWGMDLHNWLSQTAVEKALNQLNCLKLIIMGQCYGGNYTQSDTIKNAVIISANQPNTASIVKTRYNGKKYIADDYDEFICNFFSYYNGAYPSGKSLYAENLNKNVMGAYEYAKQYDSYSSSASLSCLLNFVEEPCICVNLQKNEDIEKFAFDRAGRG
jgi:hypothetical protein